MNKQAFLQQVDLQDFNKVVQYLHKSYDETDYKKSRVLREKLISDVFNVEKTDPDFAQKRQMLELIARASKTDWGQELYEAATGERGFIQATAINKKSYYESVVGKTLEKYNPRMYGDILKLVGRSVPKIVANPHMSAEEISSWLCREYGYVIGSILPSVGTIRAYFNGQVNVLISALSDTLQGNKHVVFGRDKASLLELVERAFDENVKDHTDEEIANMVFNKLNSK